MKLVISLILFCAATAAAQDSSQFDLSTNDGVNAAREAIAGKPLDDRSKRCIRRDPVLPGIVVVGGFAYDYGCRFQGAFINSKFVASDNRTMSRSALEALGWKTANRQQREKLAQPWVEKGLLGFLTVMGKKNEHFDGHPFQAPQAATSAGGEIVVTLWIRLPSGRERGSSYQLREYRFSAEGDFAGNTTLDNFTIGRD